MWHVTALLSLTLQLPAEYSLEFYMFLFCYKTGSLMTSSCAPGLILKAISGFISDENDH